MNRRRRRSGTVRPRRRRRARCTGTRIGTRSCHPCHPPCTRGTPLDSIPPPTTTGPTTLVFIRIYYTLLCRRAITSCMRVDARATTVVEGVLKSRRVPTLYCTPVTTPTLIYLYLNHFLPLSFRIRR